MLHQQQQEYHRHRCHNASYNTPVSVAFINDANANAFKVNYEGNKESALSLPVLRDDCCCHHHSSNNADNATDNADNDNASSSINSVRMTRTTRMTRTRVSISKRKRSPDCYDCDYEHHDARHVSSSTATATTTSTSTTGTIFQFPLATSAHSQTQNEQVHAQAYAPAPAPAPAPTPTSIMEHYINVHSSLRPFDPEDASEICKGASALCMMKEHQQIGVGSTSYSLKYGLNMIYADANTDADSNGTGTGNGTGKDNRNTDTNANLYLHLPGGDDDSHNARTNTNTSTSTRTRRHSRKGDNVSTITRLSLATDLEVQNLNSLHQFVRAELLELFVIPGSTSISTSGSQTAVHVHVGTRTGSPKDSFSSPKSLSRRSFRNSTTTANSPPDSTSISSSTATTYASHRQYPGRVGLRCVHCVNSKKASSGSSFFPKNIADLYRSVCTWQRVHFQHCSSVPTCEKEKYSRLKATDKTRGKTKYWETSAKAIGLVDVDSGQHQGKKGIVFGC